MVTTTRSSSSSSRMQNCKQTDAAAAAAATTVPCPLTERLQRPDRPDRNKFGRKLNHFIDNDDVMAK